MLTLKVEGGGWANKVISINMPTFLSILNTDKLLVTCLFISMVQESHFLKVIKYGKGKIMIIT